MSLDFVLSRSGTSSSGQTKRLAEDRIAWRRMVPYDHDVLLKCLHSEGIVNVEISTGLKSEILLNVCQVSSKMFASQNVHTNRSKHLLMMKQILLRRQVKTSMH